jgi:large conductance mechanosensitive channel
MLKEAEQRTRGFLGEFRTFAMRGNVIDLAVGVVIGGAFGRIVNSIVTDIFMPLLAPLTGKVDFKNKFIALDGKFYESLDAAKAAKVPALTYGSFIQAVVEFVIIAFAVFLFVRQINKLKAKPEPAPAPTTKDCPFCISVIPIKATRCPQCTSQLS